MNVVTSWLYLYLLFTLPMVLLVSLILKDRMRSLAILSRRQRQNGIERAQRPYDRAR